jgi:hypothetical protein
MLFRVYRASNKWGQRQADDYLYYAAEFDADPAPPCPCDGAVWSHAIAWWTIDIASLEDLLALSDDVGKPVIVRKDDSNRVLVIYDDYLE